MIQSRDRWDGAQPRAVSCVGGAAVGDGLKGPVESPLRTHGIQIPPHTLGQAGEVGGAEGRRLLIDWAQHGDAQLVGLLLQQKIHDRRPSVHAQLAQRRAAGAHHRLDGVTGLE